VLSVRKNHKLIPHHNSGYRFYLRWFPILPFFLFIGFPFYRFPFTGFPFYRFPFYRFPILPFPFLPVTLFTVSQFTVTQFTVSVFTVSVITVYPVYSRASVSGRMDVYYAQKIAKYVQNPEADVCVRPNVEAGRQRTSRITALA